MAKARVLAVDDQRYFRELMDGLLGEEGFEVQTAASGEEALHLLEREDFDVVITDLVMPTLDGAELCRRIKQQWPEQDIVMVTGVVDVQTAVDAMKLGVTDYIVKPFDRDTLLGSLDGILQQRRLRDEHARLMEENLEYMGALSLYERASALFSTLGLAPLAGRLVEGLCLETRAQGGVAWVAPGTEGGALELTAVRGLVRAEQQTQELAWESLPASTTAALEAGQSAAAQDPELGLVLWVPVRTGSKLLAVVRLSDKLEGGTFDSRDRTHADKFGALGASAVANALRFRELERRSFRDPATRAYTQAYFQDVVRNEIQKSSRFAREFSLVRWRIEGFDQLRRSMSESQRARWLEAALGRASRALRATDILAVHSERSFSVLMPETDSLGASTLVQRLREALCEPCADEPQIEPTLAAATYPGDGGQFETLERVLDARLDARASSLVKRLELGSQSFSGALGRLLERSHREPQRVRDAIERFAIEDFARRPHERALLFVAPRADALDEVVALLSRIGEDRELPVRSEVVLVADPARRSSSAGNAPITWVAPGRLGLGPGVEPARAAGGRDPSELSFLLYHGDGPSYALVSDARRADGTIGFFHTRDSGLVEHLSLQLQRDLGIGGVQ